MAKEVEITPWETELVEEEILLFPDEYSRDNYKDQAKNLGIFVVFMSWKKPEQDHIRAWLPGERVVWAFDQEEVLVWASGLALTRERQKILNLANRENGSFESQMGWRPMVALKYVPTTAEEQVYLDYQNSLIEVEWESWGYE